MSTTIDRTEELIRRHRWVVALSVSAEVKEELIGNILEAAITELDDDGWEEFKRRANHHDPEETL